VVQRLSSAFLSLSLAGLALAIYHAYGEITSYSGPGTQVCSINQKFSCVGVFESGHDTLIGIPFYVFGLVWFPVLLILWAYLTGWGRGPIQYASLVLIFVLIGDVFTIYLWYIELDVIGIICPICMSMYIANYALTGIAAAALR
jgi:uncharacterized membrane protein